MPGRRRPSCEGGDAFVGMPGGVGTREELFDQPAWAQLGRHKKPILIANIERFWDPLCALLDHMQKLEFIRAGLPIDLLVADRIEDILPKLFEAARTVSESEKDMAPVVADRL